MPHAVFAVIGGIICDLIIGNYESKGRMIIGYGTFALADFLGTVIPVILFGTASFVERASKWKMSEAQINEALILFQSFVGSRIWVDNFCSCLHRSICCNKDT